MRNSLWRFLKIWGGVLFVGVRVVKAYYSVSILGPADFWNFLVVF